MKICLVCERFDPAAGGLENWLWQVAVRLLRRGHQVHVAAFAACKRSGSEWPEVHLAAWSPDRLGRALALDVLVQVLRAEVVHDTGTGCISDILQPQMGSRVANYARDLASRTMLERWVAKVRPRDVLWRRQMAAFETRQYALHKGVYAAVSRMVADLLCSVHGVARERIRVIPNGVDTNLFHRGPQQEAEGAAIRDRLGLQGRLVFLFSAHNLRLKGLRPLLKAMARLKAIRPDAALICLGKLPERSHLRIVSSSGLQGSVFFEGLVREPGPYYSAADVFVLPTYYDACSLTVLEAWACGVPAITTRFNGAAELMQDGKEGFVVDSPDNIEALTAAMDGAGDPVTRARMSRAARELAQRNDMERNVDAIEALYRECETRRTPPG